MKNKFLLILLCFSLIFSNTYTVNAESTFSSKLKDYLGRSPSKEDLYTWSLVILTLRTDGFSDHAIAGIMGNMKKEGACSGGYAIEGYSGIKTVDDKTYSDFQVGGVYKYDKKPSLYTNKYGKTMGGAGHGLVQWSFDRATNLSKFAEDNKSFGYCTVTHYEKHYDWTDFQQKTYNIPSVAGQAAFMIKELNDGYKSCKDKIKDSKDEKTAAHTFHNLYEGSSDSNTSERQKYATQALPAVKACKSQEGVAPKGITAKGSSNGSDQTSQNVAMFLMSSGIWSEAEIASYSKVCEVNIDSMYLEDAKRDNLTSKEISTLSGWEQNINDSSLMGKLIRLLRSLVVLVGILVVVWGIFFYLAYWFDRLNTLVDIDTVKLLTFGKLVKAPDESECTFNVRDLISSDGQPKTVNHKIVCGIVVFAIGVGCLLVSGYFYKILGFLITKLLQFLG